MTNDDANLYLADKYGNSDDKEEREAIMRACFALLATTDDAVNLFIDDYVRWGLAKNSGVKV